MVNSGRIRILTDRVADLPQSYVDQYKIGILPIYVTINQKQFLDNGTVDSDWFYAQLRSLSSKPQTAAPSPHEFERAFRSLTAEGADVIIGLFASASISSIFNHATIAAREFDAASIRLIDTQQISMGLGWIVIAAAEALQAGADVEDIIELVQDLRKRTVIFGVLDALDYLHRSGRVSWAASAMGDLLRIKPIISFYQGDAKLIKKVRTKIRALAYIEELIQAQGPLERLALLHSNADKESITRLQMLLDPYMCTTQIPLVNVGPGFASHVGPGCLGVACVSARTNDFIT